MLEGVAQALVAIFGIAGNIACIVILSRFVMVWCQVMLLTVPGKLLTNCLIYL